MPFIIRGFLATAVAYGIFGIIVGLIMAISKDHGQHATHAHINLIGFVSFFLFAVYYRLFGSERATVLARVHFWLAQASAFGLFVGLWLLYSGQPQFEPVAAISSLAYAASFLVFATEALRTLRAST